MKRVALFLLGAVVGVAVCFGILYAAGSVFEHLGIQFYDSESDQQRNFNIFLAASAVSAMVGGYYFARRFS